MAEIKEYDKKGNLINIKWSDGEETWKEYDENNNEVYFKSSTGYESWYEYDEKNRLIYYKNSNGLEEWQNYNKKDNLKYFKSSDGEEGWYKRIEDKGIEITQQEFKQIERVEARQELYFNNKKCNRFELMDI